MKFWLKEKEDYYRKAPLTEAKLRKAEKELGYQLPKTFRKLLLEQNGGSVRFNAYRLKDGFTIDDESFIECSYIQGVGEDPGILDSPEIIEEWGMPKELILLNGDGHIWIALDYRNNKDEPSVVYIENDSKEYITIADSFDDFIGRLYIEEDGLYSFDPDEKEKLSSKLSDEELLTMLQSTKIETLDTALFNLLDYPNKEITDKYVLPLIDLKPWRIRDSVGLYFYLAARGNKIDPSILDKALEKLKTYPELSDYVEVIENLES